MRSILSFPIAIIALLTSISSLALPTSYYTESSKLASGKWVKIATDSEGIYQLTYEQLREMGFNNPKQVQVYGYGALQLTENYFSEALPDDLTPTATMHTLDGRLLFFGQGDATVEITSGTGYQGYNIKRNYYDTLSYYFLSDVAGVQDIPTTTFTQNESIISQSHIHVELFEEELHTPAKGGIGYHGKQYQPGEIHTQQCRIVNFRPTTTCSEGSFAYVVAAGAYRTTTYSTSASSNVIKSSTENISASNIIDGDYNVYSNARGAYNFTIDPSQDNKFTVDFNVNFPSKYSASVYNLSYLAIDKTLLRYPRANTLDADTPSLIMHYLPEEGVAGTVNSFTNVETNNIAVWNIDTPMNITQYDIEYDAEKHTASFSFDRITSRTIAFSTDAQHNTPQIIGEIANQDLHAIATPAMLIITTAEFAPIAEQLANIHRIYQGMDVVVADHHQIYNEFSSGSRDAMAYRRMAKMFYDRNPEKFKYILMFGISGYDNRCVELSKVDRILAYETTDPELSRNEVVNYASDNYFGMLADDYDHSRINATMMQVAVGRVPAITSGQAQSYVDKVAFRFENPPTPDSYGRAILIAGGEDKNGHLNHQLEVADKFKQLNPDITLIPIPIQLYQQTRDGDLAPQPHNIIEDQLKDGVGYVTFSGHGGQIFISRYHILDTRKAGNLHYDTFPFVMFSSCDQFSYDHMKTGLIETMLFNPRGGAIAGVGATREVYISYNQASCVPIAQAYATAKPGETYGELYLRSRELTIERANSSNGMLTNAMSYNFGGDPAIPICAPEYSAVITKFDDTEMSDATTITPLKQTKIEGEITDADGNIISDFNGMSTITILEGAVKASTYNTMKEDDYIPVEVELNYDILTRYEIPVKDGKFSGNISVPVPSINNTEYKVIVSAIDRNSGSSALKLCGAIKISAYDSNNYPDEFDAPEIQQFYINNESFNNGDEVASTIEVVALIDPSTTGLRFSTNDISSHTTLHYDGMYVNKLARYMHTLENGLIELRTTVSGLSEGSHTMTLIVANNAGIIDRMSVDFVVVTRKINAYVTIAEEPARTSATISLEGDITDSNKLIISNSIGETVFSAENVTFPYTWNLKGLDGKIVENGSYSVSVMLRKDAYYGSTPAAELIILK